MVTSKNDLESFIKCTLLYTENDVSEMEPINKAIQFLLENEFMRLQFHEESNNEVYVATILGKACLSSSMPPHEGFLLFSELQKCRQCFVLESELQAIYTVIPYSSSYQLNEIDWIHYMDLWDKLSAANKRVGKLVGIKESFLVKAMRSNKNLNQTDLNIHKRFYIAMALQELVQETPLQNVANKYKCSRGMLQSLQQNASTFAGIVHTFCSTLNWDLLAIIIGQFRERLFFGIQRELMDLMRISNLNSQRARVLYNSGIKTLTELATCDVFTMEKILYNCTSFETEKKLETETERDAKQRKQIRNIFITGKKDFSVKEAAELLIKEARYHLEIEMGVEIWKQNTESETMNTNLNTHEISPHPLTTRNTVGNEDFQTDLNSNSYLSSTKLSLSLNYSDVELQQNSQLSSCLFSSQEQNLSIMNKITTLVHRSEQSLLSERLLTNSIHDFKELKIIDVCKSFSFFSDFEKLLLHNDICNLSLAMGIGTIEREKEVTIGGNLLKTKSSTNNFNCHITDTQYIDGIAICFHSNHVFYLTLQDTESNQRIKLNYKLNLLGELFKMKKIIITIYDAKEHFKALSSVLNETVDINATIVDPKIANWLMTQDVENTLDDMVDAYAPSTKGICELVGVNRNFYSISLNNKMPYSARLRYFFKTLLIYKFFHSSSN